MNTSNFFFFIQVENDHQNISSELIKYKTDLEQQVWNTQLLI